MCWCCAGPVCDLRAQDILTHVLRQVVFSINTSSAVPVRVRSSDGSKPLPALASCVRSVLPRFSVAHIVAQHPDVVVRCIDPLTCNVSRCSRPLGGIDMMHSLHLCVSSSQDEPRYAPQSVTLERTFQTELGSPTLTLLHVPSSRLLVRWSSVQRNVANQFLDDHGLADACSTEQVDLASLRMGIQCSQTLVRSNSHLNECGRWVMVRAVLVGFDR